MGRPYRTFTQAVLEKAANAVRKGKSLRKAEELFGVPKSSIQRHMKGKHQGKYGWPPVFTKDEEDTIAECLGLAADWGFPLALRIRSGITSLTTPKTLLKMDLATVLVEEEPVWIPNMLWQHQVEVQIVNPRKIWTPTMNKSYEGSLLTNESSVDSINAILGVNVTPGTPSPEASYLITMLLSVWNDLEKQQENLRLQLTRADTTYESIKRFLSNPPSDTTHISARGKREVVGTIDTQGLIKSVSSTVKSSTMRQGATDAMLREIYLGKITDSPMTLWIINLIRR
ncbi:hypothetical protein GE061_018589 [Apolygus lucorum]|uniref:HTH psq-type domain-containing protein n=1 Tax=Apolygus lucorum TaxID=248454 RepID=A0A8S9XGD5_APOLU|nr:hypothetical protein GE061_018589 [Apolygus lucorum]